MPIRKCAGCGEHREKTDFLRVVRTPAGEFQLDPTGNADGRGAYLCKDAVCLLKARKTRRMEKGFRSRVPDSVYEELETLCGKGEQKC